MKFYTHKYIPLSNDKSANFSKDLEKCIVAAGLNYAAVDKEANLFHGATGRYLKNECRPNDESLERINEFFSSIFTLRSLPAPEQSYLPAKQSKLSLEELFQEIEAHKFNSVCITL